MQNLRYAYLEHELIAVAPLPVEEGTNGQFRIKITSERGQTKWLNITPDQFKLIKEALLRE